MKILPLFGRKIRAVNIHYIHYANTLVEFVVCVCACVSVCTLRKSCHKSKIRYLSFLAWLILLRIIIPV